MHDGKAYCKIAECKNKQGLFLKAWNLKRHLNEVHKFDVDNLNKDEGMQQSDDDKEDEGEAGEEEYDDEEENDEE
uniref:Uncharacterized protein n=1 Tax=Meloidogyne enterolobii TaxID=390850 RepID=A0A6V7V5X0_MELEN|nr:unnamed protein product [Meloidogyne enterolobii]